ncbi:fibronectin type-III domain-containing protein 3A [Nephila pilipes]|uniref:Fibronectin type-III domain-containing protein 3A n=1 Tax=Nephila pilipes TaxID=299642 RepID=A0A8X6NYS0_NEPPI|nr:fibronectin type-III domain-containing protein 3A [Nephila pilipes]
MATSTDATVSLENKTEDITSEPSEDPESSSFSNNNTEHKNDCETVEKNEKEQVKQPEETVSSSGGDSTNENSSSRPSTSNVRVFDEKRLNGVKPLNNNSKFNVLGSSLPLTPETWTVTSDSQIWLECCQNSFRACGGNVRSFQPHSKLNSNHASSPNHLFSPMQGTSSCPQGHCNANSMNYNRNSQYVVHLHVNPGETISFDMGDHVQLIQGPATVRMVSSNNTPPVPMPVQVPPGHMVQQIVDEHGTLRHIILSPQPPVAVTVGNPFAMESAEVKVTESHNYFRHLGLFRNVLDQGRDRIVEDENLPIITWLKTTESTFSF